jgi:hypothetical protein
MVAALHMVGGCVFDATEGPKKAPGVFLDRGFE